VKLSIRAGLGVAVATALCLGLTACGGDDPSDPETSGSGPSEEASIVVATEAIDHLTPGNHYSAYIAILSLFTPLTSLTQDEQLEYQQAESVTSPDGVTWTVKLRSGWTFHNGEPVTADSYIDSWNYLAYGPNAWVNAGQLRGVVGFDEMQGDNPAAQTLAGLAKVDDLTFTVQLKTADRQFPFQLSDGQTGLYPLPKAAFDDLEAYDRNPIGNGPFQMTAAWAADSDDIVVKAYPDYKGTKPALQQITFRPYQDSNTAYTDALAGNVDIAAVAGAKTAIAQQEFGDRLHALDAPGVDLLGFSPTDPRFADVRVRQAFSMAIDREAVNQAIFSNSQIPATSLTSATMPGSPEGVCGSYCEFDPVAAKVLLEEAGGLEGEVVLLYVGGWGQEDLFQAYANQLRQNLGLDVVATPATDFAEFQERLQSGDYALNRARWGALYPSQQDTLHSLYTAAGDGNFAAGGYHNADVDALLAAADAAPTLEESFAGYRLVQERILADFPVIPTFGNRYLWACSERIGDLPSAAGSVYFARVTLK
jgi:ABC-type transport system substrate-binding protein